VKYYITSEVPVERTYCYCNHCDLSPSSSGVGSSVFLWCAVVSRCWKEGERGGYNHWTGLDYWTTGLE